VSLSSHSSFIASYACFLSPPCSCSRVCFDCLVRNLEPGSPWAGRCSQCDVPYTRSITSNLQARILAQIAHDAGHDIKNGLSCIPPWLLQSDDQVLSAMDNARVLANARSILNERMNVISDEISLCKRQPKRKVAPGLDTFPIQQLCRKLNGRVEIVLKQYQKRVPSSWPQVGEDYN
jgi:hypothetical protein